MLVFLVEVEGDSTQKENEGKVYYIFEIPFMLHVEEEKSKLSCFV